MDLKCFMGPRLCSLIIAVCGYFVLMESVSGKLGRAAAYRIHAKTYDEWVVDGPARFAHITELCIWVFIIGETNPRADYDACVFGWLRVFHINRCWDE